MKRKERDCRNGCHEAILKGRVILKSWGFRSTCLIGNTGTHTTRSPLPDKSVMCQSYFLSCSHWLSLSRHKVTHTTFWSCQEAPNDIKRVPLFSIIPGPSAITPIRFGERKSGPKLCCVNLALVYCPVQTIFHWLVDLTEHFQIKKRVVYMQHH